MAIEIFLLQAKRGEIPVAVQAGLAQSDDPRVFERGNPGRGELDDTQELNYRGICKAIADLGYQGYLAHEYTPTKAPIETLDTMMGICEV